MPGPSRDSTIFMSSISSFDTIHDIVPDPNIFLCIPTSATDAATVNPNSVNTLWAKGVSTFFINGKPTFITFIMVPEVYQKFHLIVLFWLAQFSIILYLLMNYLQKPCGDLGLAYQSIRNYAEN